MARALAIGWISVMVGCGSSGHSGPARDASMDRAPCEAAYQQALDRRCDVPADCLLVAHSDCCGTIRVGVAISGRTSALMAEQTYAACFDCGARGCAHADLAETGLAPGAGQAIVATCVANRCTSIVQ